jgi:hypothetical protein
MACQVRYAKIADEIPHLTETTLCAIRTSKALKDFLHLIDCHIPRRSSSVGGAMSLSNCALWLAPAAMSPSRDALA